MFIQSVHVSYAECPLQQLPYQWSCFNLSYTSTCTQYRDWSENWRRWRRKKRRRRRKERWDVQRRSKSLEVDNLVDVLSERWLACRQKALHWTLKEDKTVFCKNIKNKPVNWNQVIEAEPLWYIEAMEGITATNSKTFFFHCRKFCWLNPSWSSWWEVRPLVAVSVRSYESQKWECTCSHSYTVQYARALLRHPLFPPTEKYTSLWCDVLLPNWSAGASMLTAAWRASRERRAVLTAFVKISQRIAARDHNCDVTWDALIA